MERRASPLSHSHRDYNDNNNHDDEGHDKHKHQQQHKISTIITIINTTTWNEYTHSITNLGSCKNVIAATAATTTPGHGYSDEPKYSHQFCSDCLYSNGNNYHEHEQRQKPTKAAATLVGIAKPASAFLLPLALTLLSPSSTIPTASTSAAPAAGGTNKQPTEHKRRRLQQMPTQQLILPLFKSTVVSVTLSCYCLSSFQLPINDKSRISAVILVEILLLILLSLPSLKHQKQNNNNPHRVQKQRSLQRHQRQP